eukprot:COSAG02_NODE_272_length_26345_cov_761.363179_4_plen_982_part_00
MPTDDHVKVGVRIKPCDGPSSCEGDTLHNKVVLARSAHGAARRYTFDHVFDEQATNAELYESVGAPLLRSALDGYNATLLAYGQTGAGKTHTIMGQGREDPGVVMRLVSQLFHAADKQGKHIQFSMLEIYNERIRDLFSVRRTSTESLRIREDPATGPFVENLSWFVAEDREAMQELLSIGAEARTVRSTHNNQHSSRAHTVVQIAITTLQSSEQSNSTGSSMICVVDLAGSERHDASGTVASVGPKTLREGCSINKSLTNLGLCISALVAAGPGGAGRGGNQSPRRLAALGLSPSALRTGGQRSGKSHIPYRNSALTWLLRESIGGNSKTAILACVNPEPRHREESLSTLRFADRAKQLTTRVDRNVNMKASVSRAARRDRILREHGVFAVGSDAQATIDALREEVRRLESTLQAHGADSGQGPPCLVPGGLITTVNGRRVEGSADRPVAFKHGDRVTVWDPASQQEHAFLHLNSTEAPKERLADGRTPQPVVAAASEEEQNQETAHAEAEHAAATLGLDSSMVSFLEAEEMAYESRSRRLSLDSSLPTVLDRPPLDQAGQRSSPEVSEQGGSTSQPGLGERNNYMDSLHRHKKRQRRRSRMALKTSAVACGGRSIPSRVPGEERGPASRYDALIKCSSSWAPCAVFILGCAAAAFFPSTVQNEEPRLAKGEFSVDATGTGSQMQQPMSPMQPTTSSTIFDWAPSVIGVLGWTMLVYMILGRWRRWLASQTPQLDKRPRQRSATKLREPYTEKKFVGNSEKMQKRSHQRRCDAGRASTDRHTDDTERHLRRRQRHQRELNERDRATTSIDQDRRQDRRRQKEPAYRSSESGARTTDHRQQRQLNGEVVASHVGKDQRRGQYGRNYSTAGGKALQDKTNTATRDHGDTIPPVVYRPGNAHCDEEKDRCGQRRREHVGGKHQHGQRLDEPLRDSQQRQRGLSEPHRSQPHRHQAMAHNHDKPAKPPRSAEAWQEQCCDALAV